MPISPYLADLRARIGNDLVVLPSVAALIMDAQRRLCLVRNRDTGDWQTVGGGIDPDEEPALAARREAMEETGLEIEITRLIGVYGGEEFRVTYPNGDRCSYVAVSFEARVVAGIAEPDGDETSAVGWFTRSQALELPQSALTRRLIADAFADRPQPRF